MSTREREERADEVSAREADEQAVERDADARDKDAEHERSEDEQQTEEEADARRGPIGPWLSRSPASRMALALSIAGVPLAEQLAAFVVEFDWRADGRFEMRLNHGVTFEVGESKLVFEEGRAAYNGLTELEGVDFADSSGQGAVERIVGESASGPLALVVSGASGAVRMPVPDDGPDMTV